MMDQGLDQGEKALKKHILGFRWFMIWTVSPANFTW